LKKNNLASERFELKAVFESPVLRTMKPLIRVGGITGCAILFILMGFALYHETIWLWWMLDDPIILRVAILNHPADFFFNPQTYQLESLKFSLAQVIPTC
jgi:hypothetical protein